MLLFDADQKLLINQENSFSYKNFMIWLSVAIRLRHMLYIAGNSDSSATCNRKRIRWKYFYSTISLHTNRQRDMAIYQLLILIKNIYNLRVWRRMHYTVCDKIGISSTRVYKLNGQKLPNRARLSWPWGHVASVLKQLFNGSLIWMWRQNGGYCH